MPVARIVTPEFRLSFPSLFTPEVARGAIPGGRFSATMLFPKTTDLAALKAAAKAAAAEKWGNAIPAGLRSPFRDGDEKTYAGYAGCTAVKATSKQAPAVVGTSAGPDGKLARLAESDVYAGCYCRASVYAFAYDQAGNRGVSFTLCGVQKTRDGEPLGGNPDKDFGPATTQADPATAPSNDMF